MRDYKVVFADNTLNKLVDIISSINTKVNKKALLVPLATITKAVAKINACPEDTYTLDGVNLSDMAIPSSFSWLIQPEAVRVVSGKRYENWRTSEDFLTSKTIANVITLSEWNEAWDAILSSLRTETSKVSMIPVLDLRLKTITVNEESVIRMVDIADHTDPTFKFETEPLFVKSLQLKPMFQIDGFDDAWISEKFRLSMINLKA